MKLAPGVVVRRTGAIFLSALSDFIAVLAQRPHVGHMPFSNVCATWLMVRGTAKPVTTQPPPKRGAYGQFQTDTQFPALKFSPISARNKPHVCRAGRMSGGKPELQ